MEKNLDRKTAETLLAGTEQQRKILARRLSVPWRLHTITAVAMGLAVSSLATGNLIFVGMASTVYVFGLVLLFGIPATTGMVPPDNWRSLIQIVAGSSLLLGLFTTAMIVQQHGMLWLSVLLGAVTTPAAVGMGRWRFAEARRAVLSGSGATRSGARGE